MKEHTVAFYMATVLLVYISFQVNLTWPDTSASFSVVARGGKTIGADIFGFEPSLVVQDEKAQYKLRNALRKHKVLVFHDVADKITPDLQVKLTEVFGKVTVKVSGPPKYLFAGKHQSTDVKGAKVALANGTVISDLTASMKNANTENTRLTKVVAEPSDVVSFGEGWHTDLTFLPNPPIVAVLVGRELPAVGLGNTKYLDMRKAFETLPEATKQMIINSYANHTDKAGRWSIHPAVAIDDESSRRSLYVNKHFTRKILESSSEHVSTDHLLDELFDHIDNFEFLHPEETLDITWSEGQMVMWEEKFTLHAAQKNYQTRRELHRTLAV